jgi:putative zinc finger/helix-turn-helix YgiT family protein
MRAMKCFKCSNGKLVRQTTEMKADIRSEKVSVRVDAMVCNRCGFQVLSDEQSRAYTIASADAYRKKYDLLTTEELKATRARLGMSFRAFAEYLKVSEASPKRWEAGLVQDEAMDELIRLKTDPGAARHNLENLESRLGVVPAIREALVIHIPRRESRESEWDMEDESSRTGLAPTGFPGMCYGG